MILTQNKFFYPSEEILTWDRALEIYKELLENNITLEGFVQQKINFSVWMLENFKKINNLYEIIKLFQEEILEKLSKDLKKPNFLWKQIQNKFFWLPTPIEASIWTLNILEEVEKLSKIIKNYTNFIWLWGSCNYWPFFSPKAQYPKELFNKYWQKEKNEVSDADMVITYSSKENLEKIINELIKSWNLDKKYKTMLENFFTLKEKNEIDFFTVKNINPETNFEVSIHFLEEEQLQNELTFKEWKNYSYSYRNTGSNSASKWKKYTFTNAYKFWGETKFFDVECNPIKWWFKNKLASCSKIDWKPYSWLIWWIFGKWISVIHENNNFWNKINKYFVDQAKKLWWDTSLILPNLKSPQWIEKFPYKIPPIEIYQNPNYTLNK